jgi:azurin
MKFNKTQIKIKSGQKIKLTLRHIGKMDVKLMGHNVVILKKDVNPAEFAAKAAIERENQYIPKDSQEIIAHTKLIGGGQVTSIEFNASEPGIYEFLCSFPGHFAMMRGKFIV